MGESGEGHVVETIWRGSAMCGTWDMAGRSSISRGIIYSMHNVGTIHVAFFVRPLHTHNYSPSSTTWLYLWRMSRGSTPPGYFRRKVVPITRSTCPTFSCKRRAMTVNERYVTSSCAAPYRAAPYHARLV